MVVWKRSLWAIELTGARRGARTTMLAGVLAVASLCVVLLVFEAHHVYGGPSHSLLGENPWPLLALAVPIIVAALALRRGLASGLLAGFLAFGAAVVNLGILTVVHLLSEVSENAPGHALRMALLVMMVAGPLTVIVELSARVLERRHLEATDPVFPTARIVSSE